jgi:Acetyltransferase (GNAT) domain
VEPRAAALEPAAPAGWSELLAHDPDASPAHRPALWRALAAVLPGAEAGALVVREGGVPIGGAPVVIERRAAFTWIHAMPFLLSGTPVARPGAHARVDAAVAAEFAALARDRHAVGGEWTLVRAAGVAPAADVLAHVPGETRTMESAVLDLDAGLDPVWKRVDRKTRQSIAAARDAGLAFAEEPFALDAAYALHVAQSRRFRGHRPQPLELSRRLLASADADGAAARLFTVRDARGLLSAVLALDGPHETLAWWSGSHRDARARHAFALLLWSMAEWAAAAGRSRLNLGASAGRDPVASFKRSLGARRVPMAVRWLDASSAPAPGRWVAALQRRMRRDRPRGDAPEETS